MKYDVISHEEIDGPLHHQPGWYVAEFADDGSTGRVIAGPFPEPDHAQARRDLLVIGDQDRVADHIEKFIAGPERFGRWDMRQTMMRAGLSETEIRSVITEVEAARDAVATFVRGQAAGCFQPDEGGCAA